jgi:hypothetical protein
MSQACKPGGFASPGRAHWSAVFGFLQITVVIDFGLTSQVLYYSTLSDAAWNTEQRKGRGNTVTIVFFLVHGMDVDVAA